MIWIKIKWKWTKIEIGVEKKPHNIPGIPTKYIKQEIKVDLIFPTW